MEKIHEVKKRLEEIPGVVHVRELGEEEKIHIRKLEKLAEENGAAGGLMEFVNKSVWCTLDRAHVLLMVADDNQGFREAPSAWTVMIDEQGNVVGEWLKEEQREAARANPQASFITDDFVIYRDRPRAGKCQFVMPPMPVPELEGIEGITGVVSGSVSAPADLYLKKVIGMDNNFWTILVGFDETD